MESKELILSYDIFVALLSYDIILKHLHVFIQIFIQHTKEEQSNLSESIAEKSLYSLTSFSICRTMNM